MLNDKNILCAITSECMGQKQGTDHISENPRESDFIIIIEQSRKSVAYGFSCHALESGLKIRCLFILCMKLACFC